MSDTFTFSKPPLKVYLSHDEKRSEWFTDTSPSGRVSRFKELVEVFITKGETELIADMIDYINIDIKKRKTKLELFIDRKRFNGKTFFQRILETKNEKLIEVCRNKGVDYDPQGDFISYLNNLNMNITNEPVIDKIIKDFDTSNKYGEFERFEILDYISRRDIIFNIIRNCQNKTILNRVLYDLDPKKEGFNLADINNINILILNKGYEYSTYLEWNISRLFDRVNGGRVSDIDRIGEFKREWEIQRTSEQKRAEAENRSKGLGIWDTIKSWFKDIKDGAISPELSPELKKVQEALKEGSRITIEGFHKLLDKLTAEDADILKGMWHKYYERKDGRPEFAKAMYYRELELRNPGRSWRERSETKSTTTPTQTSSVEPSNNTLSTATSAQNPEDTGPKVLEGEIMKPEHINVSSKMGEKYEPTTINGEYRIIDDGIAKKVVDKDIKKAPYRNQELISGGKNPDKYKITTRGTTQDINRSLPEHNNKRFITSQQEVLIPEIVDQGGVRVPGGHTIPDNTQTIYGEVLQQPGSPQTEGLDVGEITTIEQAKAKGYNVHPLQGGDWAYTDSKGYHHLMRDGIELTKGIEAKGLYFFNRNGDWAYIDSKGYQHLMRDGIELTKGIKTKSVYSPGDGAWAYTDEEGDRYLVRNNVHTLDFKGSDQEVEQLKDKNKSRWGRILEKAKGLKDKAIDKAKGLGLNVGKIIKSIPSFTKAIPKVVGGVAKAVGEDLKDKWKKLKGLNIKDEFGKLKEKAINIKAAWDSGELQKNIKKSWDKEKKRARRLGLKKYMVKMLDRYNKRDISTKYAMSGAGVLLTGGTLGLSKFASVPLLGIAKYREGYKKAYKEKILELAKKDGVIGGVEEFEYYSDGKLLSKQEVDSLSKEDRGKLRIKPIFRSDLSGEQIANAQDRSKDRIKEAKEYANKKAWTKGIIWGSIAGAAGLVGDYLRGDGPGKYLGDKLGEGLDEAYKGINQGLDEASRGIHQAFDGISDDADQAVDKIFPGDSGVSTPLNPTDTTTPGSSIPESSTAGTSQTPTPADATTPVNPNPNPISQTPNPTSTPGTISTPDTAGINSFGDNYTIKAGDKLENVFEDRMSEVFGPAGRDNPERLKEIYNMFKNPEISDMLRDAGVRYDNTGIPNIIKPGQEIPFAQILSKAKELGLLQE